MAEIKEKIEIPSTGYAVVRCADRAIVATFDEFPACERALMYRNGDQVSFMPVQPDEIVGTTKLITQLLEKAGYRVCSPDRIS
ncbi:hypothetical protein FXN80_10785 [Dickeya fangzhongdai]|uniref:hypothetical protein n=1 Tax=Dickeya fangzhongdai TaxID=1778540 RepID=UPI00136ADB81|nr:hypothetical protein [Dickeya fangzhongdai]UMB78849.1 hypothetical protein FXN80_10785 [Dickeya fangzhongdai]